MKPALFVDLVGAGPAHIRPLRDYYSKHITTAVHVATYRRKHVLHPSFSSQLRLLDHMSWSLVARILPCTSPGTDGFRGIESGAPSTFLMARLGPARSGFARLNGGRSLARRIAARVSESNTLSAFSANAKQRSCTATKDFLDSRGRVSREGVTFRRRCG